MNKVTKVLLITAGSCIVVGLLLGTVAYGAAKKNGFEAFKTTREKVTTDITDSFSNIEVLEVSDDIVIRPSEDGNVKIITWESEDQYHDIKVDDDTLKIEFKEKAGLHFGDFEFDTNSSNDPEYGMTIIYLPEGEYEDISITATSSEIAVPENYTFNDVTVTSVSGNISCSAVATGLVKMNSTSGEISDLNIDGISANIDTVSGNIGMTSCDVTGSIEINTTSGDINLTDISTSSASINVVSGDITLNNFESGLTDIDSTSGDVTGSLTGSYKISTDTVSGDINVTCNNNTDGAPFNVDTVSGDITLN